MAHRLKTSVLDNPMCAKNYIDKKFSILSFGRSSFYLSTLQAVYIKSCKQIYAAKKNLFIT